MALKIERVEVDGNWLIKVAGEVDLYTSPELRTAVNKIIPKAQARVGVDLSGVPYMDSSGVATLVEGLRMSGSKNMEFVLVSPSQAVMKVLQLSRLDTVFAIRDAL
jgi:anti-sigma B factor antagonist